MYELLLIEGLTTSAVQALGISVPGIELPPRRVMLKGFNGLKDSVKIQSFDLPSNDPSGGIHLTLEATTAITALGALDASRLFDRDMSCSQ